MAEDREVSSRQLGPRILPELLDERVPSGIEDVECLALAPAAIEGEHQLARDPLVQRVRREQARELGDDLRMTTALELGLRQPSAGVETQGVETTDLLLRERPERHIRERVASPQGKRLRQCRGTFLRRLAFRLLEEPLELDGVELLRLHGKPVARRARLDHLGSERLAQPGDPILQHRHGGAWLLAVVQRLQK